SLVRDRAVTAAPSSRNSASLAAGIAALKAGKPVEAERQFRAAVGAGREDAEALRLLAMALHMQRHEGEARALLERAAALKPGDPLIQNGLGTTLDASGDRAGAAAAFRRACELAPHVAEFWANLGKALHDDERFDEAVPALERAIALRYHHTSDLRLAYCLRVRGDTDAAAARYRAMIARDPADGDAWLGLAGLKTRPLARDEVDAMRVVFARADLAEDKRISVGFALGRALEEQGDPAGAFAAFAAANAAVRRRRPWNADEFRTHVREVLAAFAEPPAGAPNGQGEDIVFVVSMPRAGSSLTEQILAAHPEIDGGGELDTLMEVLIAESERRGVPFPHWTAAASPLDWQRLGQEYLARIAPRRSAGKRFTDKMPGNWLRVGAALAMLPGARIVDCRRDPVETCFSCYRELFLEGAQPFTYDLGDLAVYWHEYDRASRHWQRLYADRVRVQRYEDLIAAPEAEIRALLAFCGVPFDAACLRFSEARRVVRTASASQVREPLRRDTARAAKYGALLDPLRAALSAA
ncbi:MAG TPA: sulfotransferase, partial [Rudaea sp.]|nr:sulfotransferase [Rudaea sp.]